VTRSGCRAVQQGEPCQRHVKWAMEHGIHERPDLFPGLSALSSFDDFQVALHTDPYAQCPLPCSAVQAKAVAAAGADAGAMTAKGAESAEDGRVTIASGSGSHLGWQPSGRTVGQGHWCRVEEPRHGWRIRGCGWDASGLQLKVLTYNLFWWNLFGRRHGNGGSAGTMIAGNSEPLPYDIMGFQECESVAWVLGDAGFAGKFAGLTGPHALCIAYRKAAWELVNDGVADVGEDRSDQWYGTRAAMWARLRYRKTNQTVMFVNHHGPLPVGTGGRCGGEATAFNLLKLIAEEAYQGDSIILVGDFNAGPEAPTVKSLNGRLFPVFTGNSFGGVDHVLSSCTKVVSTRNLGDGGSDHDALEVVFQL